MSRIQNRKIMIVDDDKEFLEEVQTMLALSGYDIIVTSDCNAAISIAASEKPAVILLDLKMMPKSGFQVAGELRNLPGIKDTSVIAMTGFFTEKEHLILMKICGIKTCILKPIKPLDLIAKIEFAIAEKEQQPQDAAFFN